MLDATLKEKPRVLVADDDEQNRLMIKNVLTRRGFEVIEARDGREAVEQAGILSPDVILLDVQMPELDGFGAARQLRQGSLTRYIPIVMVTGLSDVESRIHALEAGADDFLSKPVDIMELTIRVRSLVKVKAYYDHMHNYQKELESEVARRTEQLQRTADQLRDAFDKIKVASLDTIYRLSKAAEYRDDDTGAHIQRMSRYAAVVAHKMGLNEKTVEAILYAAPMHDVGKIGIPDRILLKPGKLDGDEWEIMKQHTVIGAKILEGSSEGFLKLAEVIALSHHERWDGSGYPLGQKGSRIPLAGRITAIGDVFDALTSKRPYKEAFSVEKSFQIIKEGRGTHLDPKVVDAFFEAQDEILAIKDRFADPETN